MTTSETTTEETITLYRPVGPKEMARIRESGFRAFPPRLPEQPIFYPVTNEQYAVQITRDWNSKSVLNGNVGFVTRFAVRAAFLARYKVEQVGGRVHQESRILDSRRGACSVQREHRGRDRGDRRIPPR